MGISYDPPSKKWNVVYEKADNPLLPTDQNTQTIYVDTQYHPGTRKEVIANISYTPRKWYDPVVINSSSTPESILSQTNAVGWALSPYASINTRTRVNALTPVTVNDTYSKWVTPKLKKLRKIDQLYAQANKETTALNTANQVKNNAFTKMVEKEVKPREVDNFTKRELIRSI